MARQQGALEVAQVPRHVLSVQSLEERGCAEGRVKAAGQWSWWGGSSSGHDPVGVG